MLLSQKLKIFYEFFIAFLKSTSIFQHFGEKDQVHSSTISNIFDSKRSSYLNVLKAIS